MSESNPGELGIVPQTELASKESSTSPEDLKTSNRVLVYGSRVSGAFKLAEEFENYLREREIPDPSLEVCRNAQYIEDAFYNRQLANPESTETQTHPQIPAPKSGLASLVRRGIGVFGVRSTSHLETPKPGESSQDIHTPTLPRGVIVLPEMRQYSPTGQGMTIEAPYEYIKQLCEKNGVPIVKLENADGKEINPGQLSQGVVNVLTSEE